MSTMDRGEVNHPFPFPIRKTAITINLDELQSLMNEFIAETSAQVGLTATEKTLVFSLFLQWLRKRGEANGHTNRP